MELSKFVRQLVPVASIVIVTFGASAAAQSTSKSEELARTSGKAFAALQCSVLSEFVDDQAETTRLFEVGYQSGKIFLEALVEEN